MQTYRPYESCGGQLGITATVQVFCNILEGALGSHFLKLYEVLTDSRGLSKVDSEPNVKLTGLESRSDAGRITETFHNSLMDFQTY